MGKKLSGLKRARLDAILTEYKQIISAVDERDKMIDTLNHISLLIIAGYLTVLGNIRDIATSLMASGTIALGIVLMQYFIIAQMLRNDYLKLHLIEYYYMVIRKKVEALLLAKETSIWEFEHYKYKTYGLTQFDRIQSNLLALTRYGIPFCSCILICVQFYFANMSKISSNIKSITIFACIVVFFTLCLFILMLKWARYSTSRAKLLVAPHTQKMFCHKDQR